MNAQRRDAANEMNQSPASRREGPALDARQVVVVLPVSSEPERHWKAVRRSLLGEALARAYTRRVGPAETVREDTGEAEWLWAVEQDLQGMLSALPAPGVVSGEPLAVFDAPSRRNDTARTGTRQAWGASTESEGPSLGPGAIRLAILNSTRTDELVMADDTQAARERLRSWRNRVAQLAMHGGEGTPDAGVVEDAYSLVLARDFARATDQIDAALQRPGLSDSDRLATVQALDELLLLALDLRPPGDAW